MARTTEEAKNEAKVEAKVSLKDPGMELVETIFPDMPGTDYHGDITVGLNGVMYKVKRGVQVKIPVALKEIIERSMDEDAKVAAKIEGLKKAGEKASANL